MKIAILTLGTRGDVQPYAVLGRALKQRGHSVTLATGKNFDEFIRSYGLDFVPVEADFQALLNSPEGDKIRKNPFLAKKYLNKFVYPMMEDAFITFYHLAKESDKVLFHIKTMADNFADQFPQKMIKADVIPASQPTIAFANPVFSALPLPFFMNKFTYKLTDWGLKMWTKAVVDFREKADLPKKFIKPDLPTLYGVSELLLNKPNDYPDNAHFTGFWMDKTDHDLQPDLKEFISEGDSPILFTFGSMPFDNKYNLPEIINSVISELGLRAIIIKGWGLSDSSAFDSNPNIKVIASTSYYALFPKVKAIVHHGGIGTLSSCLVAGKPFLTCPVLYPMGDQHFWGEIAHKKGVALSPIPVKKLTKKLLSNSLKELVGNKSLISNASKLAEQMRLEDGIKNAITLIEI
jgi:sterol 3beta-glucosyltransferase